MIKVVYKSKNSNHVELIPEIKKGCWVSVVNPDESELKRVCSMLDLDSSIVKDAMDPYEVPRIEVEEGKTYIFTKYPYETTTSTLLIVVENEHVLLFSKEEFPALQKFLDNKVDFCTTQKTKLIIQIFMEINHSFQKRMYDINKSIYQLASKIEKIQNSDILNKFIKVNGL